MSFVFGTTCAASRSPCTQTPSCTSFHTRSTSVDSITSTFSSSSTSSNSGLSLQKRRGVIFPLYLSELPAEVKTQEHKGRIELASDDTHVPRRRRALPMPITIFDPTSTMGEVGAKISSARDFGMGEDCWTVVAP
ncbi:hypothetical protein H2248_004381 [Termitomyces sp. 'cryptogamus']|nr:hypothetical protein H2248_004381 [Termitomyces sp. 'cryptogamus']